MRIISANISGSLTLNSVDVTNVTVSSSIWSGSMAGRIANLEQFSSSLDATYATDAQLAAATASLSASLALPIAALNSYTASNTANITSLNTFSSSILSYTASNDAKISALNAQTASLLAYTSSNDAKITALNTFSSSILSYTSSNNANISSLNSYTSSATARFVGLETATASFSGRVGGLEAATASLNTYTSSNTANITSLNSYTSSATARFVGLETATSSFSGRVSGLEAATASLNTFTSSANTRLGTLEAATASLNSYTASATTRFVGLEAATASLNSYTSSNNANITSLNSYTSSNTANITSLNSYTSSATARFVGLEAATSSLNTFTSSINSRVTVVESKYATTGSNTFIGTQTITGSLLQSGSFTSTGTITAQMLVVQTITSSVIYSSGSNVFGNNITNTQVFTGSVLITGSLTISTGGNASAPTIFGSTIACSPIGCFATSCATSFIGGTFSGTTGTFVCGVISGTPANSSSLLLENFNGDQTSTTLKLKSGRSDVFYHMQAFSGNTTEVFRIEASGKVVSAGAATFSSTITGTTIYGSTAVCSAVGKFSTCIDAGSGTFSSSVTAAQSKFWDGTQGLFIGAFTGGSGFGAIYPTTVTPSNSNHAFAASSGATVINTGASGIIDLEINTTSALYIANNRNVGIGTTSPSYKLHVGDLSNTSGVKNDIFITGDTVNTDGYYARLIFGNSSQSGGSTASIRGERKTSNYGTELTFYTNEGGSAGNGSERMRITSGGNVGIGTTSPLAPFVVSNAGGIGMETLVTVLPDSSAGSYIQTYNRATSAFVTMGFNASQYRWYLTNTEKMRLDASGNLGLGVTPSAWNSIFTAFEIGRLGDAIFSGSGGGTIVSANAYFGASNWVYARSAAATNYDLGSGQHRWYIAPSGTAGAAITFTQAMTLLANGNLLLGTTTETAGYRLQVNGLQRNINTNTVLNFGELDANNIYFQGLNLAGNASKGFIWYGTSETMRIWGSTGNVNIGTTPASDSGYKLDVNGTGRFSGNLTITSGYIQVNGSSNGYLNLNAANAGGNEAGIFYQIGGSNKWENYTAANDTALNWYSYANSTVVFKLASTGAATFSSSVSIGGADQGYQLDVKRTSTGDSTFDTVANFYKASTHNTGLLLRLKNTIVDLAANNITGGGGPTAGMSFSVSSGGTISTALTIASTGAACFACCVTVPGLQINSPTYVPLVINSSYGQVGANFSLNGTTFGGVGSGNNFSSDAGINPTDMGIGTNGTSTGKIVFATGTGYATRMIITSAGIACFSSTVCAPSFITNGGFYGCVFQGAAFSTLSAGGGTGTASFDTITRSGNGLYEVAIIANPNAGGSNYTDFFYGRIIIGKGYSGTAVTDYLIWCQESPPPRCLYASGGGGLTITACMYQNSVESSCIGTNGSYTIRFKIAGYNSSYTGADTAIYLKSII